MPDFKKITLLLLVIVIAAAYLIYTRKDTNVNINKGPDTDIVEKVSVRVMPTLSQIEAVHPENNDTEVNQRELEIAPQKYGNIQEAKNAVIAAADKGDSSIFNEFTIINSECTWCSGLYQELAILSNDNNENEVRRFFAAEILSRAGTFESAKLLLNSLNKASDENSELFMEAIARLRGGEEVEDLASSVLQGNPSPKERQALVAMLGYRHSFKAAEILYNDLLNNHDTEGYLSLGIGIAAFQAQDETAIPFLESKAANLDAYSHLAIAALFQSGQPGIDRALDILSRIKNEDLVKLLSPLKGKFRWRIPESMMYFKERVDKENNPNMRSILIMLL